MNEDKPLASLKEENRRFSDCLYEINSFFERQTLHDIDPGGDRYFLAIRMANTVLRRLFQSYGVRWIEIDELNEAESRDAEGD